MDLCERIDMGALKTPTRGRRVTVPILRPKLPAWQSVQPYLEAMDQSRIYSNFGPLTRQLEARYAHFLGVKSCQVVSVANATLGLVGAVTTGRQDAWVVPAWTFPATGLAVLSSTKRLILGDIDPQSWDLDFGHYVSVSSVGLLPVVPYGASFRLDRWLGYEEVVIDAAASLGNAPDLATLSPGWAVVFSLHATKVLGAGEGGIVVFGDNERANEFRAWTNFGFQGLRVSGQPGTNAKMSEISAAYALAALDNWPEELEDWKLVRTEVKSIVDVLGLSTGPTDLADINPYWIVDCGSVDARKALEIHLKSDQIDSRSWWPVPLSRMPAFGDLNLECDIAFPVAQEVSGRVLGLPMYRDLTQEDLGRVHDSVSRFMSETGHSIGGCESLW